jgi:hypothetical protein
LRETADGSQEPGKLRFIRVRSSKSGLEVGENGIIVLSAMNRNAHIRRKGSREWYDIQPSTFMYISPGEKIVWKKDELIITLDQSGEEEEEEEEQEDDDDDEDEDEDDDEEDDDEDSDG